MQSYVVHIVGLIGNIIGFIYTSSRYLGAVYGSTFQTWGIADEIWGLTPMLLSVVGILINGLFISLQKYFKLLVSFTIISIINISFLLFEYTSYLMEMGGNDWVDSISEQDLMLKTPQICLAFLSSSLLLMFLYKKNQV